VPHPDLPRQSRRRHTPPGGFVFDIKGRAMIENLDGLDQWENAFDRRSEERKLQRRVAFFSEPSRADLDRSNLDRLG
jgi:hypothetical protein